MLAHGVPSVVQEREKLQKQGPRERRRGLSSAQWRGSPEDKARSPPTVAGGEQTVARASQVDRQIEFN